MSDYEHAKERHRACVDRLREISHDFTPEGQRAWLIALHDAQEAYKRLFEADSHQVEIEVDHITAQALKGRS